jgi:phage baseplate assembly protein W
MSFDLKLTSGDLTIKNGTLQTVTDTDKLIQDILKICLTDVGGNPIQPWYGSFLSRSIVGSALDPSVTVSLAQSQIQNAIGNLKSLQSAQVSSLQSVTPSEMISAILDISVLQSNADPRLYDVLVSIVTKAFKKVSPSFTISTI